MCFPFDPAILLLGSHPKGIIRNRHRNIHPSIVYNMGKLRTTPIATIRNQLNKSLIEMSSKSLIAWDDVNSYDNMIVKCSPKGEKD